MPPVPGESSRARSEGPLAVVVLAAGRGVRMRSALPKVLHPAAGRPLLDRVLETARAVLASETGEGRLVVVVGAGKERVAAHLASLSSRAPATPEALVVEQDPPRGTGDAVRVALTAVGDAGRVVVLSGDVPLLSAGTVRRLLDALDGSGTPAVAFLTARLPEPGSYGRVVRDDRGEVARIVEAKDAGEAERALDEVNAGVYAFDRAFLSSALPRLRADNAQGEYYLTDVLGLAVAAGRRVAGLPAADPREMLGVNSRKELAVLDALLRARAADAAMEAGATLVRPETVTLDDGVVLAPDVVVEPFVTLLGETRVGEESRIGQGCVVSDSVLGAGVTLRPYCVVDRSVVADGAVVGPFARLREGTDLGPGVHVGNFVETKKARLSRGAKANHLTYLGDVEVGEGTNVGAGVITCNYDGFGKHRTTIGAGVFVGSDVQLVAPVTVGDGAVVGAGTTVTKDVPPDALATSRVPQRTIDGGGARYRVKKKAAKAASGGR